MRYIGLLCLAAGFVVLLGLRHLAGWLPFTGAALFVAGAALVLLSLKSER